MLFDKNLVKLGQYFMTLVLNELKWNRKSYIFNISLKQYHDQAH
jgi:hypothetical protein